MAASDRGGEAGDAPLASRRLVPDPEVVARPVRRRFTAEYKRSILDQADAAQDSGAACCAVKASTLCTWEREEVNANKGGLDALTAKKRGPKVVVSLLVRQNREQQAVIARLTKKLKNAEFNPVPASVGHKRFGKRSLRIVACAELSGM